MRIGVLSYRPKPMSLSEWQPIVQALGRDIPGHKFEVEMLDLPEMDLAVTDRRIEFVLTQPAQYLRLKRDHDLASPLATLVVDEAGLLGTEHGGVIFSRADASGEIAMADIWKKRIAVEREDSLAGYQMQRFELTRAGFPAPESPDLVVTGAPQDKVVEVVLQGKADIGFVRTGVIEALVRESKLDISSLKIINTRNAPGFPARLSTALYPEWPFVALPHVDEKFARRVTAALFMLDQVDGAGPGGRYSFVAPLSYTPVEDLLRDLRLPPYEAAPKFTLGDVWVNYRPTLLVGLTSITLILLLSAGLALAYRSLLEERTQVRRQQQKLHLSETRFRTLVERSPDSILVCRGDEILYVNSAALTLFGAGTADDLRAKPVSHLFHRNIGAPRLPWLADASEQKLMEPIEDARALKLDSTPVEVDVQVTPVVYDDAPALHVSIRDVSERKKAEEKLELFASVFSHAREGIMIMTPAGNIIDINDAFTRITSYTRSEVLGQDLRILSAEQTDESAYRDMWNHLKRNGQWYGELSNRRKNGEVFTVLQTTSAVKNSRNVVQHYVALFSDITPIKEKQQRLEHIAHFDVLTGLPNRSLLSDRLRQGMTHAVRRGQLLALAFLDLDGFKSVNDTHGHAAGDHLLTTVARRMKQVLRDGDTLARLGGDEFVALIGDLPDVSASQALLDRLIRAAAVPVEFGEAELRVSASLGVTFFPQAKEADAEVLFQQADQAMYQAKQMGKNRYVVFTEVRDL